MKAILVALSTVAALAGCSSNGEDVQGPPPMADSMSPLSAQGYMAMAASSDLFEIESSRLALQQSQNPAVRQFAQMMITDHTRSTQELTSTAQSAGLNPPPPSLLPPQQAALDRVRSASSMDFDATYKREQIAAHQQALALHQNYAASGDNTALRGVASRVAGVVQNHYSMAQSLPEYSAQPQPMQQQPEQVQRAGERG